MQKVAELEKNSWWSYLEEDIQELLKQSIFLVETVEEWTPERRKSFHDYSFVVFPAAKSYEGFLKKLFFDLRFINEDDYFGKRFRIGKSLNPSLDKRTRAKYGVYDKIVSYCKGDELAQELWLTWKECRNLLFHWFPNESRAISFSEAVAKVNRIIAAMGKSFVECKVDLP